MWLSEYSVGWYLLLLVGGRMTKLEVVTNVNFGETSTNRRCQNNRSSNSKSSRSGIMINKCSSVTVRYAP